MSDRQCDGDFDMAAFDRHVSDHVEIDYADPDLGVKNPAETIDNRILVYQRLDDLSKLTLV